MTGHYFFGNYMSVTSDGKFNLNGITLVSKNGKFYFEIVGQKHKVKRVNHDLFKTMLIAAYNLKSLGKENPKQANTLEYLLEQLEMTEDLFKALLYPEWIDENKE